MRQCRLVLNTYHYCLVSAHPVNFTAITVDGSYLKGILMKRTLKKFLVYWALLPPRVGYSPSLVSVLRYSISWVF